MALKRLIPCLLYDGTALVKTKGFKNPEYIGDPVNAIRIFNEKEVDELMLIDIMATKQGRAPDFDKIENFASECFMPFAYGGGVRSIDHFETLYRLGVEKVMVNNLLFDDTNTVKTIIRRYGSQSVIASIDVKRNFMQKPKVYSYTGKSELKELKTFICFLQEEVGVGEIMLTALNREGSWDGFDMELYQQLASTIKVPLIASGGAGSVQHLREVLQDGLADAAAIGSMAVYQKKGMGVLLNFPERRSILAD